MPMFRTMKRMVDRHYKLLAATNCNTCSVGTWAVFHENHLMQQAGGSSMIAFFKRLTNSRPEVVTDTMTPETARCDCERQQCKILIVSKGQSFSQDVADYAINMAKKTRSAIVALSLDESGRHFDDFCAKAKDNINDFSCKAADAGLSFCHEIRQGEEETVVSQLYSQDPQFRYIMDDSVSVCKHRSTIPVYTRATMRAK